MDEISDIWEQRYASSDRVWSGNANRTLIEIAQTLPKPPAHSPGRSLDLGCGEGADTIWLAEQGWRATGVDISPSAIARARVAAEARGLSPDRIHFEAADLETAPALDPAVSPAPESTADLDAAPTQDATPYDLVTACFLQSPVALAREQILRRAAARVAPGGHLLIISHAAPPPWSQHLAHHHPDGMPQPDDDLAALDLPPELWDVVLAEVRQRPATGPDGEHAILDDGVLLLRRRP